MIAKKCDCCGKFYDEYNVDQSNEDVNGFMFLNIDSQQKYYTHKAIDCCTECISKLKEFVKSLKGENIND